MESLLSDARKRIYFATGSRNKYTDYEFLLGKYADLQWVSLIIEEPKTLDFDLHIRMKVQSAAQRLPYLSFVVEQTGLMVHAWRGLPGTFTTQFQNTVGNEGICRMLDAYSDRSATAVTDLAYRAITGEVRIFRGAVSGTIAQKPRGGRGFGWDTIFIPEGESETFAEMTFEKKNSMSTRMLAASSFYSAVLSEAEEADKIPERRVKLRQQIVRYFNKGDLADLIYDLGVDPDDIPGTTKRDQARELILYCDKRGKMNDLLTICKEMRPHVSWPEHI